MVPSSGIVLLSASDTDLLAAQAAKLAQSGPAAKLAQSGPAAKPAQSAQAAKLAQSAESSSGEQRRR